MVETAAGLKVALETQMAALCRGERVNQEELARLSCELRAVLGDLKRGAEGREPVGEDEDGSAADDDDEDE